VSGKTVTQRRLPATLAVALLPALLAIAVYAPALDNPFVYDDRVTVVENPSIRELANWRAVLLGSRFRPLVNLTYAVDYALWQLQPTGYHWTSVLLHALNVLLLYALLATLDRRATAATADAQRSVAFVASSLFAVHPLLSEAVGYVSGRAELLSTCFFLGALLSLRNSVTRSDRSLLLLGIGLGIGAMASKETGAMLPIVFLAWDRWLSGRPKDEQRRRFRRVHLPVLVTVGLLGAARVAFFVIVEAEAAARTPWQNLLTQFGVIWRYVGLTIVPIGQSLVHSVAVVTRPSDGVALLQGGALLATLWLAIRIADRQPAISFGIVWFLVVIAPSSSLIPLLELMAEHRVYMASAGLFLLVGHAFRALAARGGAARLVALLLLASAIVACCVKTVQRLEIWHDSIQLWQDAAERAPDVWVSQYGLGDAYRRQAQCDSAIVPFLRAIEIQPQEIRAYVNLGACLAQEGRIREAEIVLRRAFSLAPSSFGVRNNLAAVLSLRGRETEALAIYQETLAIAPENLTALKGLAALRETRFDNRAEAIRLWREIRRLSPGDLDAVQQLRRLTRPTG